MDEAEFKLFESGIRRATETGGGEALEAALTELGWHDALRADHGTAVSLLFEAQGAANVTSSALDAVLGGELGEELVEESDLPIAVVLPQLRRCEAPGRLSDGRCLVRGLGTEAMTRRDTAIVVTARDGAHGAVTVKTSGLELRPLHGLDPALGLVEVAGDFELAGADGLGPVDWDAAVARGQLALGHELVGSGRAMLELARQHALQRIQFGRPIGSFQAVRHRLAEGLVAIEAAAALLGAAWDEPSPLMAAMAKGLAGRSARTAARHAQQVLAGIGFTTEHPLHRYVRRALVLDQLLGAGTMLARRLGIEVLENGSLPPTFPL
jgi:hypothetical protein